MKKLIFALISVVGLSCISLSVVFAAGPEVINLKEKFHVEGSKPAVHFPHAKHQARLACTKCHLSNEGGKLKLEIKKTKGFGNDFHKKFCWPCHVEMKVPKGKTCATCHN